MSVFIVVSHLVDIRTVCDMDKFMWVHRKTLCREKSLLISDMYIFLILFVPIPPSFFFMQNQKSTDNPHQTQKHFHKDLRREQKFYDENQQNVNDAEEEAKQFCADLRRL